MEFFSSSVTNTLQSSVKYNYIIYFNLKFCINLLNVTKFCMYHKHVSLYIASMAAIKFSPYLNEFISVTVMQSKSKVCPIIYFTKSFQCLLFCILSKDFPGLSHRLWWTRCWPSLWGYLSNNSQTWCCAFILWILQDPSVVSSYFLGLGIPHSIQHFFLSRFFFKAIVILLRQVLSRLHRYVSVD